MSKQLEKIKQLIEKREQARLGGGETKSTTCSRSTAAITSVWRRSSSWVTVS